MIRHYDFTNKRFLCVDTGVHTGWAIHKNTLFPKTGEINCPRQIKLHEAKAVYLYEEFSRLLDKYKIDACFIESVQYFENDLVSRTANVRGDLFFLNGIGWMYWTL